MTSISADDFFEFAKSLVGVDLETLGKSKTFRLLEVLPAEIKFRVSTGKGREATRPCIAKFCERYSRTGSKIRNDYKDIDLNGSYLLAIVDLFEKRTHRVHLAEKHNSSPPKIIQVEGHEAAIQKIANDQEQSGYFEAGSKKSASERVWREIAERRGQGAFRTQLINAYCGKCAVTGCRVLPVLEAAHIKPFCVEQTFSVPNGLLLRADIHTLFDLNLIGVDPDDLTVAVATSIESPNYRKLHGKPIHQPTLEYLRPSKDLLRVRWQDFCEYS